ncbi:MAG: hypothetical protein JRF15_07515 [Deltaproteobacteria bacterium]|nr:hypothetical protein [Deltaproteobacteria bacterium]
MSEAITIVDAHAHLHACFAPEDALDAAWDNFAAVAADRNFTGVLMLAEPVTGEPFAALRTESWTRWTLESGSEPVARCARRVGDNAKLWLASGFQVVTLEGLEVLCLGCERRPEDRLPIAEIARQARESGALAVVPWGAGKWLGRRGAVLSHFLESVDDPGVFLGDNGGRPDVWRPRHFAKAAPRGIRVLPGSDPLPFASEVNRLGGHGFIFPRALPEDRIVAELIARLLDPGTHLEAFGSTETLLRFVGNQIAMQWQMRARRGSN